MGVPHPYSVAAVGFHSRAHIPAVKSMRRPPACCAVLGFGVDKDPTTRGRQGDMVVIVFSIDLCPSRQFWVNAQATEEIKSKFSLI